MLVRASSVLTPDISYLVSQHANQSPQSAGTNLGILSPEAFSQHCEGEK